MIEEIITEKAAGRTIDPSAMERIRKSERSFLSSAEKYTMSVEIDEEGTCTIQFSSGDQVYTTYTYANTVS